MIARSAVKLGTHAEELLNTPAVQTRYGTGAQALHWLMFLLIGAMYFIGLSMAAMEVSPERLRYFSLHKSIGVTLLVLLGVRLLWRQWHPAPALPVSMPGWERSAARIAHALLYALMAIVPITGWAASSALGASTAWFGQFSLPDLVSKNRELGEALQAVHYLCNKTLLVLIVLHVAAALKHALVDRDGVLQRMLPWPRRSGDG